MKCIQCKVNEVAPELSKLCNECLHLNIEEIVKWFSKMPDTKRKLILEALENCNSL
jgi:predicted Fe-S protein YdhL (DUF1289 family)